MKSWIEISAQRLTENYRATRNVLAQEMGVEEPALLAVIKANGYGHGSAIIAPVLARAGAEWLGVTEVTEGAQVLAALAADGITAPPKILIMCGMLAEDAEGIVQHRLTPAVWDRVQMQPLAEAVGDGEPLAIHLEIDSGMSRQGVQPGPKLRELLRWLASEPRLRLDGVMTHFASAEEADPTQSIYQRERFTQAMAEVAESGLSPAWVHVGNTSGIDNGVPGQGETMRWLAELAEKAGAKPMARAGAAIYGHCLPIDGVGTISMGDESRLKSKLQPVMTWKTRIAAISEIAPGERIGYNGVFHVEHPMRVALLPIGYADGLRRELSGISGARGGGWVMIRGRRAPIVGRVSMNLTSVDVTEIDGVATGDEVVVLGESITAEDHGALACTIMYEILCAMRAPLVLV